MLPQPTQPSAPAGLNASEPFVSAHTRAIITVALFVLYIVVALFALAANLLALVSEPVIISSEGGETITLYDILTFLSILGSLFVCAALAVAFLAWLYRVSKNVPALGTPKSKVEYAPVWAVCSFFVPFVNLVIPYKAVREVWEKSDPAVRTEEDFMFAQPSSAPFLVGWWIAWLASNVLSNIVWRIHDENLRPDMLSFVAGFHIVAYLVGIVAAVLAIFVVLNIDRRQAERARHVTYAANLPPPPPLFRPQPQTTPGTAHGTGQTF